MGTMDDLLAREARARGDEARAHYHDTKDMRGVQGYARHTPPIVTAGDFFAGLGGLVLLAAYVVAAILVLLLAVVPLAWWWGTADALRSVLEVLPLGGAVAETPAQEGNPWLVGSFVAVPVIAGFIALTVWRRQLARDYLRTNASYVKLFGVSFLRAAVLFGGLSLAVDLGAVADGADLREQVEQAEQARQERLDSMLPGTTATEDEPFLTLEGPIWAGGALVLWGVFAYMGLGRLINREASRPTW